jgi:triphosphoribosyl-dephospho-CoA synthase
MNLERPDGASPQIARLSPGRLAAIACLLEVTARKPGNVHRYRDHGDLHLLDFLLSATAIVEPLDRAIERGLGATILSAVQATRAVVCTNTNLGMILLLAPLAAVPPGVDLAGGIEPVLTTTTREDARLVYQAIRLACPGGLGTVAAQDVAGEPSATLREVMALAAGCDLIGRQYANGFHEVLHVALPALSGRIGRGEPHEGAIVATFLELLARHPDSLIARKHGAAVAADISRRAAGVLEQIGAGPTCSAPACREFDAWLGWPESRFNPGTTADLITAALFAALRDGTIPLPRRPGSASWSGT